MEMRHVTELQKLSILSGLILAKLFLSANTLMTLGYHPPISFSSAFSQSRIMSFFKLSKSVAPRDLKSGKIMRKLQFISEILLREICSLGTTVQRSYFHARKIEVFFFSMSNNGNMTRPELRAAELFLNRITG